MQPIQDDGNKCEFGHYYNSIVIENKKLKDKWNSIDKIHKDFHTKAKQVDKAIEDKDLTHAKNIYNETEKLSKVIINKLESIIEEINKLNENNETVF